MFSKNKKTYDKFSLINRFNKYNKFKEFTDLDSMEVKAALFLTILTFIICGIGLNLYENFNDFEPALQNICIYISTSMIGLIGIILAGIAIIIGTLNNDNMSIIEKNVGEDAIEEILISFEFLAFISAIEVVIFFILYLILYSQEYLWNKTIFYLISFIIIYLFIFTIFYTVSLVSNTVHFFISIKKYDKISLEEKSLINIANEVRIDFIISLILKSNDINKDEFSNALLEFVQKCNVSNKKDELENYLKKYYKI